ncbi:hypothetical protein HDU96_003356 [Phlyctochytrium bullatum]|nr:hypothetical protein HDU96_003356 [Phlyctochytrium bullatum]
MIAFQAVYTFGTSLYAIARRLSSSSLDFGDCYAGLIYAQRVVLRNISDSPIDIFFQPENANVVFQLKADEKRQNTESEDEAAVTSGKKLEGNHLDYADIPRVLEVLAQESKANSELSPLGDLSTRDAFDLSEMMSAEAVQDTRTIRSKIANNRLEDINRIEELVLKPGTERSISIGYLPDRELSTSDAKTGKLFKRNFRIHLEYSIQGSAEREKKSISCKARVCTSLIDVMPKEINFGDTDVGTLKSAPLKITNLSELPAKVQLRFISKVLNSLKGIIQIPPKQTMDVKIDIYPRKVNPEYCKQITVVNLLNRENDQIVEVRSNHIDKSRVTFHSLFYRILTPSSANFIDFGASILNSPMLRTFSIENISKKNLHIELNSSMPDDLLIFKKADINARQSSAVPLVDTSATRRKERLLETISEWKNTKRFTEFQFGPTGSGSAASSSAVQTASNSVGNGVFRIKNMGEVGQETSFNPEYLDLASAKGLPLDARKSPKRKANVMETEKPRSKEKQDNERIAFPKFVDDRDPAKARALSAGVSPDEPYRNADSEMGLKASTDNIDVRSGHWNTLIDNAEAPVDNLIMLLEDGLGVSPPLFSKASAEEKFVRGQIHLRRELENLISSGKIVPASFIEIPPEENVQLILSKPRKIDAKIFIRLIDFDRSIEQPHFEQLLQSDLSAIPVRELMIRSSICRSIMELGQKYINFGSLDKNEPKTKTIVIRNKSEAPLLYLIKKTGSIASGDLIIGEGRSGVANIRNPTKFHIETESLEFGDITVNQAPAIQYLTISNVSNKQARNLELKTEFETLPGGECTIEFEFDLVTDYNDPSTGQGRGNGVEPTDVLYSQSRRRRPTVLLSPDAEEKIEFMEQKLKIAERKQKPEKAKKIREQLERLKFGGNEDYHKSQDVSAKLSSTAGLDSVRNVDLPYQASETAAHVSDEIDYSLVLSKSRKRDLITFSLEPRVIRTVALYLSVKCSNTLNSAASGEILKEFRDGTIFRGKVLVSEVKNADTTREVPFSWSMKLPESRGFQVKSNMELVNSSDAGRLTSHTTSRNVVNISGFSSVNDMAPEEKIDSPTFAIERALIDLGRLEKDEPKDCYFTALNLLDQTLVLNLSKPAESLAQFESTQVELKPKENRRIYLRVRPVSSGLQTHDVYVSDHGSDAQRTVTFSFHCVWPTYFLFRAAGVIVSELDFGPCYINAAKRFTNVEPIEVENISEDPVYLTANSNLEKQCLLFADRNLEIPATDLYLKPGETLLLFVALQPYYGNRESGQTSRTTPPTGDIRPLVGGLRFQAFTSSPDALKEQTSSPFLLCTQVLKFTATIGMSQFSLSHRKFDFGVISTCPYTCESGFEITNQTPKLPLRFEITVSDGIEISPQTGIIDLGSGGDSSLPSQRINFKINIVSWGFFYGEVRISNINNPALIEIVEIIAFADIRLLKLHGKGVTTGSGQELPKVSWTDVYVSVKRGNDEEDPAAKDELVIQKRGKTDLLPLYEKSFEVMNETDELLELITRSDLLVNVRWVVGNGHGFLLDKSPRESSMRYRELKHCGQTLFLHPRKKAVLYITVPKPPVIEDVSFIESTKQWQIGGFFLIENPERLIALQALFLHVTYALSLVEANPTNIELGKVGYSSNWSSEEFSFVLKNQSSSPLYYELEMPSFIEVKSIDNDTTLTSSKTRIEPNGSQVISAILKTRSLESLPGGGAGAKITIQNLYNHQNVVEVNVAFTLTLCEYRLQQQLSSQPKMSPIPLPGGSSVVDSPIPEDLRANADANNTIPSPLESLPDSLRF